MKKIIFIYLAAISMVSCYKTPSGCPSLISIKTDITAPHSKMTTSPTGVSSFTDGDSIGVVGSYNYDGKAVKWTYYTSSMSWKTLTPMYWKDKTSPHIFYAFSPYTSFDPSITSLINMPTIDNQNGTSNLFEYDFLYDEILGTYSTISVNGTITFSLKHASCLLILNIKSDNTSEGGEYSGFTLANQGIATGSKFDFNASIGSQVVFNSTPVNKINVNLDTQSTLSSSPSTYFVIVNPKQSLNTDFTINYKIGGVTYTSKGILPDDYISGKIYTYNITITLNDINISPVLIEDWEPGSVVSPDIPTT